MSEKSREKRTRSKNQRQVPGRNRTFQKSAWNKHFISKSRLLRRSFITGRKEVRSRAGEAVRESEERLRLAMSAANMAIWDWNILNDTVKWTNTHSGSFGPFSGTDTISGWRERIHPDDRERVLATMNEAIRGKAGSWTAEYRFLKCDAAWADVFDRAVITRDASGKARRIVGAMLDVTEQRRAQDELRRSHEELEEKVRERTNELAKAYEFFKKIFSSIDVNIAYLDRDLRFISVNPAYAASSGRTPEYFVGKNYFAIFPDAGNSEIFRRVLATGEPYIEYEKMFPGTGASEEEPGYWDWSLQPVKDLDGIVGGLILSAVNVTDRKLAEENLLRLAAAVESAADAVVITDTRGYISYVNTAFEKMTGYAKKEAIGRDLHLLDSGKQDEAFYRDLRHALRHDGVWTGRLTSKKKDGTIYEEECTYAPIWNQAGETINFVSIKRDVTEKLKLESIAHAMENMNNIGFIFSGVRHEIANPVNSTNMILSVLKEKLARLDKAAIEDYIDRSLSEISRVNYLLRTLRNFNLYEKPELQTVSVKELLNKFILLIREDFRVKGIEVKLSMDPDAEYCFADPRALQQILINLFMNAVDALKDRNDPRIQVSVASVNGSCRIRVEDNGCGMTGQEQANLFKPFYTTKAKGTGLGLVIVKKMTIAMNGSVEILSRKDVGTAVDVILPG